ncbi:hypothetical protein [Streptomyces sp. NBRC 110028]|uniref:hypothetical protein n=1 Tax=Streptomyces sp. NBRC 110028 TaxID=1621260 RepID=UPI0006E1D7F6|nr:hypothetical protein [Streptomyces sp. NBRC 110028]
MNDPRTSRRKPKPHTRGRRARRGRGRRVLILAAVLGPVLAAVFVAELDTEGYWRTPSPTFSSPDSPGRPASDRTSSAGPEPSGERTAPPSDGATHAPGDAPTSDDDAPTSTDPTEPSPNTPAAGNRTPAQGPDPTHPNPPPPSSAAPAPGPSPTCTRFLWWCA